MLPARSKGHSLPRSPDQLDDSALGHLRYVRGEGHQIQGPFPSDGGLVRVLSSFVVDRAQADVYREAAVQNVGLSANGELDFSGATYKQSGRGDRAISTLNGTISGDGVVGFHEPIIETGQPRSGAQPRRRPALQRAHRHQLHADFAVAGSARRRQPRRVLRRLRRRNISRPPRFTSPRPARRCTAPQWAAFCRSLWARTSA